jgi:putative Ca2+/H+ antiporter (TMEM165/GDT1 family)
VSIVIFIILAAYGSVFVAELVGDKSIYTISSLASRFRAASVFCGLAVAFMLKMLVAVLAGQALAELPTKPLILLSVATFFTTALILWFKKTGGEKQEEPGFARRAVAVSFGTVFFMEWGDVGQITAAMLAARYQEPLAVWVGASLALMTKGALALALGAGLRRRVPTKVMRYAAVSICLIMGLTSFLQLVLL